MQYKLYFSSFFFIILTCSFFTNQTSYIEIKDRKELPKEIYASLKNYKAILIGELHGNNESPEFVQGMVNLWLSAGEKVLLGLEIQQDNQKEIDNFLLNGNIEIINNMPFFNRTYKDGRSSIAMANLILSFYGKKNLKIVCMDIPSYSNSIDENRDSLMAINLNNALKQNQGHELITLSGDAHNKIDQSSFGSMAYWLFNVPNAVLKSDEIIPVDIKYQSGNSWCCIVNEDCGIHQIGSSAGESNIIYDNYFMNSAQNKVLFTRYISASTPINP